MKITHIIIVLTVIISTQSCKKGIFGPNSGTVEGTITNAQGDSLQNVKVTAKYLENNKDVDNPVYKTISTSTDIQGYYKFEEVLLLENEISIEKSGLETNQKYILMTQKNNAQILDFQVIGYPEITSIVLSKDTIYQSTSDTCSIHLNIKDTYNENNANGYTASALLYDNSNALVKIIDLPKTANSATNFTFTGVVLATAMPAGTYQLHYEVLDSDDNLIGLESGAFIVLF